MASFSDVRHIRVDLMAPSHQQVRTREVDKDLEELVDNIRVHGQLEPIIVAPSDGKDSEFEIIAGQRRWLAMKQLGRQTILAAVLAERVDETTANVLSISENLVRRDVDSRDLIDACTRLYRKYGTIRAVADELGLPYNRVRSFVKFDRLRPELKRSVEAGELDVKAATRIEDHLGDKTHSDGDLERLINAASTMTSAQLNHYLKNPGLARRGSGTEVRTATNGNPAQPGAVHQFIVTLPKEEHLKLRLWAREQGLTQDGAAAKIICAYLRTRSLATNDVPGKAAIPDQFAASHTSGPRSGHTTLAGRSGQN